jgi:hypothetical protein
MTEFLELLKTVGPALAILIWLIWQRWLESGRQGVKLTELYERLIECEKQHALDLIRFVTAQFKNEKDDSITQSYIEALKQKADELKLDIEHLRKTK